jgi:hypothetical protein
MAGESLISNNQIEKRAADLEVKLADEARGNAAGEQKPPEGEQKPEGEVKPEANKPASEVKPLEVPQSDKELRKWATKLSMENADIRRELQNLASALGKAQKKPVDWKSLAKDPDKLEKAIEAHNKELEENYQKQYAELSNQQTAELTEAISQVRAQDKENYPRWTELLPVMRKLADPTTGGDSRVNFAQHPKLVLDSLYELAVQVADADPNWKKPAAPAAGNAAPKSFTQAEVDAQIAKAVKEAQDSANSQRNGAGVGSMGKGSSKGKPGNELDKEAAWNMPLGSLKDAIQKATENLH